MLGSILLAFLVFAGLFVWTVVRRAKEFQRLLADGVEATGTVVKKRKFHSPSRRTVLYEYQDRFGNRHTHRSTVGLTLWQAVSEGGPIDIVYSESNPAISAPKMLVDASRAGMARKAGSTNA